MIYSGESLAFLAFFLLLIRLIWIYPKKKWLPTVAILTCFAIFFYGRREMIEQEFKNEPASPHQVLVLPDTIKVNGDSLSFRGKINDKLYQLYYKLRTPAEKNYFQRVTDLMTLEIEGEYKLAEGQRNFSGFNYQA
jgi:hypothetical protein